MMSDTIADMLTRIRNGQQSKIVSVFMPYSKMKDGILKVFKEEGYIENFSTVQNNDKLYIDVRPKYLKNGAAGIEELRRISKPGCRVYTSIKDLKPYKSGMGIYILSTSRGIMSDRKAHDVGVGGELLCVVF